MRDIGMRGHTGRSMDACNPESLWDQLAAANQRAEQAEQRAAALRSAGQWTLPWLVDGLDNCQECGESSESCTCELGQFRALLAASGGAAPSERASDD